MGHELAIQQSTGDGLFNENAPDLLTG